MGNSGSRCNDSLLDHLVRRERVLRRNLERAFRLVDRAHFLPQNLKRDAYTDLPVRCKTSAQGAFHPGALHISTTDVYITALGELQIQKGHSFLNIGSGVGYLSTIVGFLVGDTGINDGIEVFPNLVKYAEERIDEYVTTSEGNCIGWTRPRFAVANVLDSEFLESHSHQYDRIYLSFILDKHEAFSRVLRMLKVGGVLVAPSQTHLCRYTRIGEDETDVELLANMRFAIAVDPEIEPPKEKPSFDRVHSLSHLARQAVRRDVRNVTFDTNTMRSVSRSILLAKNQKGTKKRVEMPRLANPHMFDIQSIAERIAQLPDYSLNMGLGRTDGMFPQLPDIQIIRGAPAAYGLEIGSDRSTTSSMPTTPEARTSGEEDSDEEALEQEEDEDEEEEVPGVRVLDRINEALDRLAADDPLFMRVNNCTHSHFDEGLSGSLTGDEEDYPDEADFIAKYKKRHQTFDLEEESESDVNARSESTDAEGPSTSSAAPKKLKKRLRKRKNREAKRQKIDRPLTEEDTLKMERREREKACLCSRGCRDRALLAAHRLFKTRIWALPIPKNLKAFIASGKYQVE